MIEYVHRLYVFLNTIAGAVKIVLVDALNGCPAHSLPPWHQRGDLCEFQPICRENGISPDYVLVKLLFAHQFSFYSTYAHLRFLLLAFTHESTKISDHMETMIVPVFVSIWMNLELISLIIHLDEPGLPCSPLPPPSCPNLHRTALIDLHQLVVQYKLYRSEACPHGHHTPALTPAVG